MHKALPSTFFVLQSLHTARTTKLAQSTSQHYFVLQSLHKALPSTTCTTEACTKHFPVLLCTTKLAQSTSQYYFVLQSLHKARSSTTLYYKACTTHFPVLLCTTKLTTTCTTKLAQSTSQYYFVLQSLHKALPSTTLYYEASASMSQYYFVLQILHKALPGTTLLRRWQHQMTTIMQPFHSDLQAQIRDTHRTTHTGTTLVAEHRGGTHSRMKRPSRPPAHTRYLSSPAEATLHGKTQGFVLRLPPQHKPHATFMQPLQCVLQHHVANLHVSTHMATPDDNNHAAIPQRSASTDSRHA